MTQELETLTVLQQTYPRHWAVYNQLGTYYLNLGQVEAAEKAFREALTLRPDMSINVTNVARSQMTAGQLDDARTLLERAVAEGVDSGTDPSVSLLAGARSSG